MRRAIGMISTSKAHPDAMSNGYIAATAQSGFCCFVPGASAAPPESRRSNIMEIVRTSDEAEQGLRPRQTERPQPFDRASPLHTRCYH
jgi:hypothetical protein